MTHSEGILEKVKHLPHEGNVKKVRLKEMDLDVNEEIVSNFYFCCHFKPNVSVPTPSFGSQSALDLKKLFFKKHFFFS